MMKKYLIFFFVRFLIIFFFPRIMVLSLVRGLVHFETTQDCTKDLHFHILAYIGILGVCLVLEVIIAVVSLRGTILSPEPRCSMEYLLYVRLCESPVIIIISVD